MSATTIDQMTHAQLLHKTQKCKYFKKGKCQKGDKCTYAHDSLEKQPRPCFAFMTKSFCRHGADCKFQHIEQDDSEQDEPEGTEELTLDFVQSSKSFAAWEKERAEEFSFSQLQKKSWADKVCKYFKKGKCTKGDDCSFCLIKSHMQRLAYDKERATGQPPEGKVEESEPELAIEVDEVALEEASATSSARGSTEIIFSQALEEAPSACGSTDFGQDGSTDPVICPMQNFKFWLDHQMTSPTPLKKTRWADISDSDDCKDGNAQKQLASSGICPFNHFTSWLEHQVKNGVHLQKTSWADILDEEDDEPASW